MTPHRTPPPGLWPFIGGTPEQQRAELTARAARWAEQADTTRHTREHATLTAQQRRKAAWPPQRIRQLMADARAEAER